MFLFCQWSALPRNTSELHGQVQGALAKVQQRTSRSPALYEISFPAVKDPNAALSRLLDANALHAQEIIRPFVAALRKRLHVVFPDIAEAKQAQRTYGTTEFLYTLTALPMYRKYVHLTEIEPPDLILVVQPGFNVEEWLQLERPSQLYPDATIVVLNGTMDRLRSNYYPPIFYPRLTALRKRYLEHFEPIYYLKPLRNGMLFRVFPEPWQTLQSGPDGEFTCIAVDNARPSFAQVEERLGTAT